ncbi:MAG: Uncharacterized protein CEN90_684 [Parcubacteria group bacterium Licking1014_17]|nr:MAG: Uncharacterized protein CEN90_684 [Parcubacteria group bacterium Licking1014_17]
MNKTKNQNRPKPDIVWNLKPLFKSDNDSRIEKERRIILQKSCAFINKWKKNTDYLTDPKTLLTALREYEKWIGEYAEGGDGGYYFWLRNRQNQNNPDLKAKLKKTEDFFLKIDNNIQFFTLNLAKIPAKTQKQFLAYPELAKYKHFLKRLFDRGKYFLSDPEEKVLNLTTPTSYSNWVRLTSDFLAKEEIDGEPFSKILGLIDDKDKKTRDSAVRELNNIFAKYVDVAEAEMNSLLAYKKVTDELRKFPRPDASRHISDDVETEVVDSLLKSVSGKFEIAKKYYKLKAQLFGVKKLQYHERNLDYGDVGGKYSYGDSINLVSKVLAGLDPEFSEIFRRFNDNGQIDAFPRKGKSSGAFCTHSLKSQPTYLFLNHTDKLVDVLTIAHEMGHAINNELTRKRKSPIYFGALTSTTEVASTFMEDFVLEEILKQSDDEKKLAIIMQKLNSDVSSIFRQIAFYRFEQELHKNYREKGYLTHKEIGALFQKHMVSYMGGYIEQSPGSENWWVYVGHFRRYFYVYSYASGLLISKSLQSSVRNDHKFMEKVKEFLSTGTSDSPKNIFKSLGVDIASEKFWGNGLKEVETLLQKAIQLAKKLGKI